MRAERALGALALLALAACRGDDLILGEGRATERPSDAAVPEPPIDAAPRPEFGEPRLIAELAIGADDDDDPSLSDDRLLLCFNSQRDGGEGEEDIWCATRDATDDPWGTPVPLASLNTEHRETGIALSPDGLTLWFSSDRDEGDTGLDVYTATRPSRGATWPDPVRVPSVSSGDDELVSSVDASGLSLLLARRHDDDDDYDIYLARRSAVTDAWRAPEPLDGVNSDDEESDGFLVGDGSTLLFTRDADLVVATRPRLDAPFDRGAPIDALNSDADDRDAWADPDFTYVLFSSDRDGVHRLYEAKR